MSILKTAGWSKATHFKKFYLLHAAEVGDASLFAEGVLNLSQYLFGNTFLLPYPCYHRWNQTLVPF